MKVTIKDIAQECGISAAAVSMALSQKPNRISQKTREMVLETAQRLGYQPNQAAVSLATKRSRKIGLIINDLTNPHISALFMAIDRVVQTKGYLLLCHVLADDVAEDGVETVRRMVSNDVAGIIWCKPIEESERPQLKAFMDKLEVPVVTMDESGFSCRGTDIVYDYVQAAYLATQHLLELGHKRIGCVSGTRNFKVTADRLRGYRKALEEAGVPFDEELIYSGNYALKSGRNSLSYLLGKKVTAIFSMNDEMAFGIYQSARIYGVKIPEQLSVIGCDNVPYGDSLEVPLSTLDVPTEEMGTVIGKRMLELIEGDKEAETGEGRSKIYYRPVLLVKGSTARMNGI